MVSILPQMTYTKKKDLPPTGCDVFLQWRVSTRHDDFLHDKKRSCHLNDYKLIYCGFGHGGSWVSECRSLLVGNPVSSKSVPWHVGIDTGLGVHQKRFCVPWFRLGLWYCVVCFTVQSWTWNLHWPLVNAPEEAYVLFSCHTPHWPSLFLPFLLIALHMGPNNLCYVTRHILFFPVPICHFL